jgi:hypothetical protein
MPQLPPSTTSPKDFLEDWLPAAFAEAELPEAAKDVEVTFGIRLEGDEGGEWVFHLDRGVLRVEQASREAAAFTLVQSVDDWRGALFEGRGGMFGQQATALFRPGAASDGPARQRPGPDALAALRNLDGLIRMVVSGGEGGDWAVGFKLGPGPIPGEPTTTVTVSADDAVALGKGELDPMQAFMSGKIQIAGDMGLMMQMQMALGAGGGV